ncbi:hypothetical protein [Luteolibacter sp. LG18]|uniref:hypothetical protein n=1 Tax=Luteolibacter sp. LG18 TaxID=2819286 RepID=UPI002B2F6930|nr:hypothetical protein llg_07110 [Luteolibacter sp. LG18]BCU79660.1 hypothetical protein llg_43750 [Luteolibacter sp. LG18]
MSLINRLDERLAKDGTKEVPKIGSFREFLEKHARARTPDGRYVPYSLEGREALIPVIEYIDLVLGSHTGVPLEDSVLALCGGAQFGKTILELNLMAYMTAIRFQNVGLYLPDENLVEGVVDSKLRPDVIQQIDFLGPLMTVGKAKDNRGRALNRKGAFSVNDGKRNAVGMIMGMNKIPTTFSMELAAEDEKDDIPPKNSKYLVGRMAAGKLRFRISIGTQRMHGAGQNKEWEDGSQGISVFDVGGGKQIRLETSWPQCCRLAVDGVPKPSDPKLTHTGQFENEKKERWPYKPGQVFYLADPETGAVVDRRKPIEKHLVPDRIEMRNVSFTIPQLAIDAIDLNQIVSRWQAAVIDPDSMIVFCCEVLALPKNATQALSPEILIRSRGAGEPFNFALALRPGTTGYGGLDTGNRCWFVAREVASEVEKRIVHAEEIPIADVVRRAETLFHKIGLTALFVDARPAVNEARQLCYKLNGLEGIKWPKVSDPENSRIEFPGGLVWDGKNSEWKGLKCAVVEFTRPQGGGIVQEIGQEQADGITRYYPVIKCNRFDTIDRVVNEFLTPEENVYRQHKGEVFQEPVMRLPVQPPGSPAILQTLDRHLITGSAREEKNGEKGDYVDKCENHLTLADAYSGLAEQVVKAAVGKRAPIKPRPGGKRTRNKERSLKGV